MCLTQSAAAKSTVVSVDLDNSDDEVYLATAGVGAAHVLVTDNLRHFSTRFYGEIEILTPSEFFDRC